MSHGEPTAMTNNAPFTLATDIQLYDTTLRDGLGMEGISLSLADKLLITQKLDDLGVHYIEGGYPGSNPKDAEFFERARDLDLKHAKLVAFGSTRRAGGDAATDAAIQRERAIYLFGLEAVTAQWAEFLGVRAKAAAA